MAVTFTYVGLERETWELLGYASLIENIVPCTDTNAYTPADVYADHTPNVLVGGDAVPLTFANWVITPGTDPTIGVYPEITWTFAAYAGGTTIQGYMVYKDDAGTNILIYGDVLSVPFDVPAAGGELKFNLKYKHGQCP